MKEGRKVERGEPVMEIYSESEGRMEEALELVRSSPPVRIEGMVIEKISHSPKFGWGGPGFSGKSD